MFVNKCDFTALRNWQCLAQITLALGFGFSLITQLPYLPKPDPQKLNASWLGCWLPFLVFNAVLWVRKVKTASETENRTKAIQTVAIYLGWIVSISGALVVIVIQGLKWKPIDTLTTVLVSVIILLVLTLNRFDLSQARTIGLLALACKALPQVMMALSHRRVLMVTFVIGSTTIAARLIQTLHASKHNWDSNSRWNFASEAGNGLSWLLVGLVSLLT
jgi:hypothetical protein